MSAPLSFTTEELNRAIAQLPAVARLELENLLLKNRLEELTKLMSEMKSSVPE